MTVEEYETMWVNQCGLCAICGPNSGNTKKMLCVDHDHSTKQRRGLLCDRCNRLIGLAKENFLILRAASRYLLNWKKLI